MSRGLKTTLLVHAIVSFLLGIGMYVSPQRWAILVKWTPVDPATIRGYGALVLAVALSSWLGYQATRWEEVRILVAMEIALTLFSTIGALFSVLFRSAPSFLWVAIAVWGVFAVLWIYWYVSRPRAEPGFAGMTEAPSPQ